jgi:hypothetical protein
VLASQATDGHGQRCGSTYPSSSGWYWTKLYANALPGYSVGINNDGVFGCRGPSLRHFLGCFLLCLCFSGENLSPVLWSSDDSGFNIVSFLGESLWNSCLPASPVEASREFEDFKLGGRRRLKLSLLFSLS